MAERQRMTTRFKELFAQQKFFVMAGGMNPIGAKMAEALGYEVFYMSGGNTSAHQLPGFCAMKGGIHWGSKCGKVHSCKEYISS